MASELHENHGKVTLDTIHRLYRRNSRVTLYKLVQKTHSTDMAWVFRYLNPAERRDLLLPHLLISLVFPAIFSLREAFSLYK